MRKRSGKSCDITSVSTVETFNRQKGRTMNDSEGVFKSTWSIKQENFA